MRECCWRENRCECNVKNVGFAVGWLGVIYRTLGIGKVAVIIAELPDEDQLYLLLYSILLTYGFASLAGNFLLIIGISKKKQNYMLPYLGLYGIEILAAIALLIGGIIFFVKNDSATVLSYFVSSGVIGLAFYIYLWNLLIRLFNNFKIAYDDSTSISSQKCDLRSVGCICTCFKSDSLDIIT